MEDNVTPITDPAPRSSRRDRSAHAAHQRNKDGEFGEGWELDEGGYSVDNFYTSTTFGKGDDSVNLGQLRVPNSVSAEISVLVQSGKLPKYKGWQEFARDAVYHRLHYVKNRLAAEGTDIFVEFQAFHMRAESERWRQERDLNKANVESHRQECQEALEAEDWFALDRVVTRMREECELLREPYQSQLYGLAREYRKCLPVDE